MFQSLHSDQWLPPGEHCILGILHFLPRCMCRRNSPVLIVQWEAEKAFVSDVEINGL